MTNLQLVHNKTLQYLGDLPEWPANVEVNETALATRDDFRRALFDVRSKVLSNEVTVIQSVRWYSEVNGELMEKATQAVKPPEKEMWRPVVAYGALLRFSDAMGIQRALGATLIETCEFNQGTLAAP